MTRSFKTFLILATCLLASTVGISVPECRAQDPDDLEAYGESDLDSPDPADELAAISDLLLDERFRAARDKAEALLDRGDLSSDERAEAKRLLENANAKLGPSSDRPKIEITGPRKAPGPAPAPAKPNAAKAPSPTGRAEGAKATTFRVRLAVIGSGFRYGTIATLQISEKGISCRDPETAESWLIPWKNLEEAKLDDGLWDSPHPLLLLERSGKRRYLSRIDAAGAYLPGKPILDAISRFHSRGPRRAAEAEPKAEPPEEEP